MGTIIRHVRDFEAEERRVLEQVIGQPLEENQDILIQIVAPASQQVKETLDLLPDWCNAYDGLTDEQVAEVEKIILQRGDLTRSSQ